jgi:uncharacterized protein with HEPN domain
MSFEPRDYLLHILAEVVFILERSEGLSREDFLEDETLQRAFVRSLEVIGEAVKKLPAEYCANEPRVDWRRAAGMRDRLIHDYFGVDYDIVWDVIQKQLPDLRKVVEEHVEA